MIYQNDNNINNSEKNNAVDNGIVMIMKMMIRIIMAMAITYGY